jgi:hypothetical protein
MQTVLDVQRRSLQLGRIRIGEQVDTGKTRKDGSKITRPAKLAAFRLTSGSADIIHQAAEVLGGEARPWQNGNRREWEVYTGTDRLSVSVPPRDSVITQSYELWKRGAGCIRRCNSQVQRNGEECACPHAADPSDLDEVVKKALERAELAKRGEACHLVTRLNVRIPDLLGWGVWRLDTGSVYAAGEMVDQAEILEMARDANVALPALVRIEQRTSITNGETRHYPVPVLDLLTTARALFSGELAAGGTMAQLPPAPGERVQPRAITGGQPANGSHVPAPRQAPRTAQDIADGAATATTPEQVAALIAEAEELRCADDYVCTNRETDLHEELGGYLLERQKELSPQAEPQDPKISAALVGVIKGHFTSLGFAKDEHEEFVNLIAVLAGVDGLAAVSDLTQPQGVAVEKQLQGCKTRAQFVALVTQAEQGKQ